MKKIIYMLLSLFLFIGFVSSYSPPNFIEVDFELLSYTVPGVHSLNFDLIFVDDSSPTYSNIAHNNTVVGESVKFSILWNDNSALNPNGQHIFSTNNSGTWINDSAANFTTTPNWANVTKVLNSTVGLSIGFRWYATDNSGNANNTEIFTLTTTSAPVDTCTYTTGNWNVDCSDNCSIESNVAIDGSDLIFDNAGFFYVRANITNYGNINFGDPSEVCSMVFDDNTFLIS